MLCEAEFGDACRALNRQGVTGFATLVEQPALQRAVYSALEILMKVWQRTLNLTLTLAPSLIIALTLARTLTLTTTSSTTITTRTRAATPSRSATCRTRSTCWCRPRLPSV